MTAPLALADVDWRAVLVAGMAAVYGVVAVADPAAPLVCDCAEVDCGGDHLWLSLVQPATQERAGGPA